MATEVNKLSKTARFVIVLLVVLIAVLFWLVLRIQSGQLSSRIADSVSIRQDSGNIQWKLPGGDWQTITTVSTLTGQAGKDGAKGADGQDGVDGQAGANGQDGKNGSNGTNGADGKDGVNGVDGSNGIDGKDGQDGATGTTGATGAKGDTGATGADGKDGTNGTDGQDGADGQDGVDGTNGTNGTNGREIELQKDLLYIQWRYVGDSSSSWTNLIAYSDLKGDTGATGATGPANTLSIGTVTKPADCNPTASITGTAPNQTLNLGIPGLPNGGTTGQVLQKKSGTNCDVEWATPSMVAGTASQLYVQSRGQNLVTNGSGLMGNNYNFSGFTFDQTELYSGMGSFKDTGYSTWRYTDEMMPVDPSDTYRLSLYAKATTYVAGAKASFGMAEYDIDGRTIADEHYREYPGSTDTTLAVDLKPGDTTITLTDATGWQNGGAGHQRNIAWYGYTNSKGYTYPDYTYTRNISSTLVTGNDNYANGLWAAGGISGNVITLRNPWNGPAILAGKAVRNNMGWGGLKYIAGPPVNIPNFWGKYSGAVGGIYKRGDNPAVKFNPGTAYVKLLFLLNRDVPGNVTNLNNITFAKNSDDLLLTSPNGTRYRVNVANDGTLSTSAW